MTFIRTKILKVKKLKMTKFLHTKKIREIPCNAGVGGDVGSRIDWKLIEDSIEFIWWMPNDNKRRSILDQLLFFSFFFFFFLFIYAKVENVYNTKHTIIFRYQRSKFITLVGDFPNCNIFLLKSSQCLRCTKCPKWCWIYYSRP